MSSSNQVRIALIEESTYGSTPGSGNFKTARFTSDSLSGSPETTESQQIRTDRASSGQVVTGLTVGGDMNFELAKEDALDLLFKSAMYSDWVEDTPVSVSLDIDASGLTLTRASGDWNSDVVAGDVLTLSGFTNTENNTQVMVGAINSATELAIIAPDDIITESGGTTFEVADKMEIGTTKTSIAMEKAFLDLTTKAINYNGIISSGFTIDASYGSIITGTFNFMGNGYEAVSAAGDFMTNGRTIDSAATSNSLNGSVDMPFIANSASGSFGESVFCIQSVNINLNNNLTPQTCIGTPAPNDYSEGTAQIGVSLSAYLADGNWNFMAKKLSQESFAIGFVLKNADGFYAFYMPAIQLTFDDPASAGQNEDVIMSMSGVAKVGPSGEAPLRIFRG
jgi:hypothetical protein